MMRTLQDLSDEEVVRDADAALNRAGDDTIALANWAMRYGRAAILTLKANEGQLVSADAGSE